MMRLLPIVLVLFAACDCGERLVSRSCATDSDCPASNFCRDGICIPVQVVTPNQPDAGLDAGLCSCSRGEVCRAGLCVSGCAALICDAGTTCSEDFVACVAAIVPRGCGDRPAAGEWDVYERWRSDAGDPYRHVMGPPVVADLDGDGFADVVAHFFPDFGNVVPGKLRALSGRDGAMLWQTDALYSPSSGVAIGRRAGVLTVFAYSATGELHAVEAATGRLLGRELRGCDTYRWGMYDIPAALLGVVDEGHDAGVMPYCTGSSGRPIAFELQGERYRGGDLAEVFGFSAVADLFDSSGRPGRDHRPEIVVVESGWVTVIDPGPSMYSPSERIMSATRLPRWNADAGRCEQSTAPPNDQGGAPAIADLDGDGAPDVAVAGHHCLSALEPTADAGFALKWVREISDLTSGMSSVSAFDFDADGRAELVQIDEHTLRIVDGATGDERLVLPQCSATGFDQPVIADLDGDGHAELVIAVNTFSEAITGCDPTLTPGIRVLAERNGRWANARPIWNQHSYHVTNVCDGEDLVCGGPLDPSNQVGAIPPREPRSWDWYADARDATPYNGYRLTVGSRWDAPELALAGVVADLSQCPGRLTIATRVENRATRTAPAGALVQFIAAGVEIARAHTTQRLRPGAFEIVRAQWNPPASTAWPVAIEASVNADGRVRECTRSDDRIGPVEVRCD